MSGPSVLRYGIVSKTATYWNAYMAVSQNLFSREGLDVRFTLTGSTAATIRMVLDGTIDLGGCSPDELVSAREAGEDLVVVGGIINRPASRIVGSPGIRSLEDLAGRRIGVNQVRGSVSMVLTAALQAAGLHDGSYTTVEAGTTLEMAAKLRTGHIDAAMLTAPFDVALVAEGFIALADVGEVLPRYAFTTINARRDWVTEHPAELAGFFHATRAAGRLIASRRWRRETLEALAAQTGLSGSVLDQTLEIYQAPGVLARRGEVRPGALRAVVDLMRDQGLLRGQRPLVRDFLYPQWLPASGEDRRWVMRQV